MIFALATTGIAILFTLIIYFLFNRYKRFHLFEELGIPGPKPHFLKGNPVNLKLGSSLRFTTLRQWKEKYGKVVGYYSGPLPTVIVRDLDVIKQITIKDFENFTNRSPRVLPLMLDLKTVLNLQGQRWKEVRKILTPAFSAIKLRHLTPLMWKSVEEFGDVLENVVRKSADFDIYDRFLRFTLDVILETTLAMKVNCQHVENSHFYKIVKNSSEPKLRPTILKYFPGLSRFFRFLIVKKPVFKTFQEVFDNLTYVIKMRRSDQNSTKTVDMLQLLLDAAEEDQKMPTSSYMEPVNDEEIIGTCLNLVFAGFKSTASTLAYVAYMLSINSEVQDKVYQEIISSLEDLSNVTYDDTNKLHYLDQVIEETLRLYPPFHTINRICGQDYQLDGMKIPKGMKIELPIYNIHRDPEFWPDPEVFDPERFSLENKGKIHPAAYTPFGIGPRKCIGMRFALLEIKFAIIKLLTKYRLVKSVLSKHPTESIPIIVYIPKSRMYVKVEPRIS